jgi:hypothetical protein
LKIKTTKRGYPKTRAAERSFFGLFVRSGVFFFDLVLFLEFCLFLLQGVNRTFIQKKKNQKLKIEYSEKYFSMRHAADSRSLNSVLSGGRATG